MSRFILPDPLRLSNKYNKAHIGEFFRLIILKQFHGDANGLAIACPPALRAIWCDAVVDTHYYTRICGPGPFLHINAKEPTAADMQHTRDAYKQHFGDEAPGLWSIPAAAAARQQQGPTDHGIDLEEPSEGKEYDSDEVIIVDADVEDEIVLNREGYPLVVEDDEEEDDSYSLTTSTTSSSSGEDDDEDERQNQEEQSLVTAPAPAVADKKRAREPDTFTIYVRNMRDCTITKMHGFPVNASVAHLYDAVFLHAGIPFEQSFVLVHAGNTLQPSSKSAASCGVCTGSTVTILHREPAKKK